MLLETKLLIACFVVLAAAFVWAVMKVLGAWADHHISRHDLIVESRRMRLAYFNSVAERQAALEAKDEDDPEHSSVIIEEPDEAPALAA